MPFVALTLRGASTIRVDEGGKNLEVASDHPVQMLDENSMLEKLGFTNVSEDDVRALSPELLDFLSACPVGHESPKPAAKKIEEEEKETPEKTAAPIKFVEQIEVPA